MKVKADDGFTLKLTIGRERSRKVDALQEGVEERRLGVAGKVARGRADGLDMGQCRLSIWCHRSSQPAAKLNMYIMDTRFLACPSAMPGRAIHD